MIKLFFLGIMRSLFSEKLKIVDKIHGDFQENDVVFEPTVVPPIKVTKNFIFADPEEILEFSNAQFTYRLSLTKNITQKSISQFDQSRHVLGVFIGFGVENFRFSSLKYNFGDIAGCHKPRSVNLRLKCGENLILSNITEPENCIYEGTLHAPGENYNKVINKRYRDKYSSFKEHVKMIDL